MNPQQQNASSGSTDPDSASPGARSVGRIRGVVLYVALIVPLVSLGAGALRQVERNPAVDPQQALAFDSEVAPLMRAACLDCHSHATEWPWYSYFAPVSWLLEQHVRDGREGLNFSRWAEYELDDKLDRLEQSMEELEDGQMPPADYLRMHPEARLDDSSRERLYQWLMDAAESIDS